MPKPTRPGWAEIHAYRWVPFDDDFIFETFDFTGAAITLQVREAEDGDGAALIDLSQSSGLSISTETVDGVIQSRVRIQIAEATIEALKPFPANGTLPGEPVVLKWALHITPSGGVKARYAEGDFFIHPGANKA